MAIADGRLAAAEILADCAVETPDPVRAKKKDINLDDLLRKKAFREYGIRPVETPLADRKNFNLVMAGYSQEDAIQEASRCLQCDEICNVCVSVCPNLANFSYTIDPVTWSLQKAVIQA